MTDQIAGWTILIAAAYVPFFYIEDYALNLGIRPHLAYLMLTIMNAANLVGRFALGKVADRFGGVNTLIPLSTALIANLLAFRFASGLVSILVVIVLYGLISGAVITLQAPAMINASRRPNSQIGLKMVRTRGADAYKQFADCISRALAMCVPHSAVWWETLSVVLLRGPERPMPAKGSKASGSQLQPSLL